MSTSHDESSPITLELVQQVLEDCYGENRFWLSLFKLVVSMIPIQNYKMMTEKQIVQPLQKEDDDDEDDEEDDEEEEEDDQEEEDEDEKDDTTSQNTASDLFFKKDYMAKKDEEEDDERMQRLVSQNYCYFTVRFEKMLDDIFAKDSESATTLHNALYLDIKTHKLAVILSIFDRHGMILNYFGSNSSTTQKYLNKITYELAIHAQNIRKYVMTQRKKPALPRTPYISECDQMCVGLKDSHHSISILKFCYSILCDKEDTIYQPTKENSSATVTQKLDSDDDVKIPPEKNIAVGPLTEDAFMPFVKYRLMDQPEFDNYAYGVTRVVASMEGQWQRAHFASSKPGWCCGFWNANFYWYHVARFQTAIDFSATRIILRVEQNQSDILHNLC